MIYERNRTIVSLSLMALMLIASVNCWINLAYSSVGTATDAKYCSDSNGSSPWCAAYSEHAFVSDESYGIYSASTDLDHGSQSIATGMYLAAYSGPLETTVITAACGSATADDGWHTAFNSAYSSISGGYNSDGDGDSESDISVDGD